MKRTMRRIIYFVIRLVIYLCLFFVTFHLVKELLGNAHPKGIRISTIMKHRKVKPGDTATAVSGIRTEVVTVIINPTKHLHHRFQRESLPFCDGLYRGDQHTLRLARKFMRNHPKVAFNDKSYEALTNNCDEFKRSRQYVLTPTSDEERNFPIAYSIIAYKGAEQVERLLRSIYMPQNYYCIHYDAKSGVGFRTAMESMAKCFDNVFVASKIIPVRWGTIDVLEAEMNCLHDLINYKWMYFINLTGQEMPLKSNRQLMRILKAYNGANDIEGTVKQRNAERFEYVHINNHITNTRKSPPPWNMTITKGAIHIIASREFIEFALHDQRARDLYQWLQDTGVPDESFFSTLNHNPQLGVPGAYRGIPETHALTKPFLTRFKNWRFGPFHAGPCYGQWVRDVCVLGIGDLAKLNKRHELFVNKFDLRKQFLAFECAEERIYNLTRESVQSHFQMDVSYYEKLSFVRNRIR